VIKVVLRDDDQEFCRMLLGELDHGSEMCVFPAEMDQSLLNLIPDAQPDVVVLDCMQPVERGVGLITAIMRLRPEAQILVISNISDDQFVHKLRDLGTAYYLIKPFQPRTLIERITYVYRYSGNRFSPFYGRAYAHIQQFLAGYLEKLGIPPHYKGHRYLLDAILLASQDHAWLSGVTKRLYPAVARHSRTTACQVERSIRYAIDTAWAKGDLDELHKLFPHSIDPAKGKPTNSAFIAKMADLIQMRFSLP